MPLARIPKRPRFYEDAAKVATTTVSVAAMRRMVNSIIATIKICTGTRPGIITTAQAKREAGEAIGLMRRGMNPNEQKRAAQGRSITLQEAADLYLHGNKQRAIVIRYQDADKSHVAERRCDRRIYRPAY